MHNGSRLVDRADAHANFNDNEDIDSTSDMEEHDFESHFVVKTVTPERNIVLTPK